MFIDITVFGRAAETANQYLKKGSQVLVEGRLSFNQWTDNTGQKRSKHEVIAENVKFLGGRDNSNNGNNFAQPQQNYNQGYNNQPSYNQNTQPSQPQTMPQQQAENNIPSIDIDEEDIPF
jgi:single-strand DNA-binding protein